MRLLYLEDIGLPLTWESSLTKLQRYVKQGPSLTLASEQCHIIFYAPPGVVGPEDMDCWVGVEVLGHESLPPEAPYQLLDLDGGECYGLANVLPASSLSSAQLLQLAKKGWEQLTRDGVQLASTWQILWNSNNASGYIDIQFFPKL